MHLYIIKKSHAGLFQGTKVQKISENQQDLKKKS